MTKTRVASKRVEVNHSDACPPQWLPVLLAFSSSRHVDSPAARFNEEDLPSDEALSMKRRMTVARSGAFGRRLMSTHTIDFVEVHGQPAVRKQFLGNSFSLPGERALNKQEAFALEVAVLERLRATMLAEKHSGARNETCHQRHLPFLLRRDDTTLTFETTDDGYKLSTPQGQDLFCAMPLDDVTQQDQCITATMKQANVRHLDFLPKNLLIQKGKNTNRITLYDFDISSIGDWDGHVLKPATKLSGYTVTGFRYDKINLTAHMQQLFLTGDLGLSDLHNNMCCSHKRCNELRLIDGARFAAQKVLGSEAFAGRTRACPRS